MRYLCRSTTRSAPLVVVLTDRFSQDAARVLPAGRAALPLMWRRRNRPRRRVATPGGAHPSERPIRCTLATFPGAVDRSPKRLVRRLAREKHAADRLAQASSGGLPTRRGG